MEDTFEFTFKISTSKANHNNALSFWALLICVFAYISIFYLFNLSPWVLFNTNKFWFLVSNTLIIIIAADSGAFSSSKTNNIPHPLDHLVCAPHYNFRAFDTPSKCNMQEKEKNDTLTSPPKESKEKSLANSDRVIAIYDRKEEANDHVKPCQRSDSERVIRVVGDGDEDDKIGLSSSSMKKRDESKDVDEENDQFSSMSDEELNRRVEEFIRRFYSQQEIRPQRRRKVVNLGTVDEGNWIGRVTRV